MPKSSKSTRNPFFTFQKVTIQGDFSGKIVQSSDERKTQIDRNLPLASIIPFIEDNLQGHESVLKELRLTEEKNDWKSFLVTGMGGVGKTTQVIHALSRLDDKQFPLYYLDAQGFSTGLEYEILSNFITQIEPRLSFSSTSSNDIRRIWTDLTEKLIGYVVIDNVRDNEHWERIRPHPNAQVIVISRHRLSGFPNVITIDPLEEKDGIKIALSCANLSNKNRLSDKNAKLLHRACDGLPLAIRVAAATIDQNPYLDVSAFLSILKNVEKDVPQPEEWERRVKARLRISLSTLSPNSLKRWALLGLFPTSFALNHLSPLWGLSEPDMEVSQFLARHLVMPLPVQLPNGQRTLRYRLHDLFRTIAIEELDKLNASAISQAHRNLTIHLAQAVNQLDALANQPVIEDLRTKYFLISLDIDTIRSAIEFTQTDQDWESAENLVTFALSETTIARLPAEERYQLVTQAISTVSRWENERPEDCQKFHQKLLLEKGLALRALSRASEAEEAFNDGLKLAKLAENKPNQAAFWGNLGDLLLYQPARSEEALKAFRTSLSLLDKSSSKRERSALLNSCGNAFLRLGNIKGAKDAYWISQSLDEEIGDHAGIATSKGNLANIAIFESDYENAIRMAVDAADIEEKLGLEQSRAQSLQIAGKACFLNNDLFQARKHFTQALSIHKEQGQLISITMAYANIAAVEYQDGNTEEASQNARAAIKHAANEGHLQEAGGAMRTISMIYLDEGKRRSAYKTIRCALSVHTSSHSRAEMIEDVLALVRIFQNDNQPETAKRYLVQAEDWVNDHGQLHHKKTCERLRRELEA